MACCGFCARDIIAARMTVWYSSLILDDFKNTIPRIYLAVAIFKYGFFGGPVKPAWICSELILDQISQLNLGEKNVESSHSKNVCRPELCQVFGVSMKGNAIWKRSYLSFVLCVWRYYKVVQTQTHSSNY
jgi:hypothetical protein